MRGAESWSNKPKESKSNSHLLPKYIARYCVKCLCLKEENNVLPLLCFWFDWFIFPFIFLVKDIERRKETSKSKVKDPEKTNASKPAPEGQMWLGWYSDNNQLLCLTWPLHRFSLNHYFRSCFQGSWVEQKGKNQYFHEYWRVSTTEGWLLVLYSVLSLYTVSTNCHYE